MNVCVCARAHVYMCVCAHMCMRVCVFLVSCCPRAAAGRALRVATRRRRLVHAVVSHGHRLVGGDVPQQLLPGFGDFAQHFLVIRHAGVQGRGLSLVDAQVEDQRGVVRQLRPSPPTAGLGGTWAQQQCDARTRLNCSDSNACKLSASSAS